MFPYKNLPFPEKVDKGAAHGGVGQLVGWSVFFSCYWPFVILSEAKDLEYIHFRLRCVTEIFRFAQQHVSAFALNDKLCQEIYRFLIKKEGDVPSFLDDMMPCYFMLNDCWPIMVPSAKI